MLPSPLGIAANLAKDALGMITNKLISDLPELDMKPDTSLYVCCTYPDCGCGPNTAELYMGTRRNYGQLISKVTLPVGSCNNCCKVFGIGGCCCPSKLVVEAPDGTKVGEMELGRAWSRCMWWPYLSVKLGDEWIGKMQAKCCCIYPPIKDYQTVKKETKFTSKKCTENKLLCTFTGGLWAICRCMGRNHIEVEQYYVPKDPKQEDKDPDHDDDIFQVIADTDCCGCCGCGCIRHYEIKLLGGDFVGKLKPKTYMMAFAAGILEGFGNFT